jgi:hypothetical protein
MEGVSPNTKMSIQEALLNGFRKEHGTASKKQKTATSNDVVHCVDKYRNSMSHIHRPIVAEDFVCGTTVDSSLDFPSVDGDIDVNTRVSKDPDAESETILWYKSYSRLK